MATHCLDILGAPHVTHLKLRAGVPQLLPAPAPDGLHKVLVAERQQLEEPTAVAALVLERRTQR